MEHARGAHAHASPGILLSILLLALGSFLQPADLAPSSLALEQNAWLVSKCLRAVVTATASLSVLRAATGGGGGSTDQDVPKGQAGSPYDRAGFLSRISYYWVTRYIELGKQRRLELADVPELPTCDATATAARAFKHAFDQEFRRDLAKPSFLRICVRLYGWEVGMFALWSTLNKAIGLGSPYLIKLFLDWSDETRPLLVTGYYLAGAMVLRSVLAAVSGTQYSLAWTRFDIRVRAGLVSAIYDRTLSLSATSKRQYGIGRITNLISVDVGRVVGMPNTIFDIFLIPGEIAVALLLLSKEVSYAFVAGLAVLAVMLPIQTVLGGKIQNVTRQMLQFRDERVNLTAECLKSIKTLKLLAWIDCFMLKMDLYRQLEMGRLTVRKYLDALCVFFWASTPAIVQSSVFATVIFTGHDITAANAFTAISLLDRLIFPMNYFPWIINGFLEARVSALRIREFLFASGKDQKFTRPSILPPRKLSTETQEASKRTTLQAESCKFAWNGSSEEEQDSHDVDSPLLGDSGVRFTLQVDRIALKEDVSYVVCGPVGAGKSSLLLAFLGEMPLESGRLSLLRSRASYAPQTPWLFRASVRQNITLCEEADTGRGYDVELYQQILRACELHKDLIQRKAYDLAQVSENGSNFSGGQKIRINLARALYQRTKLYLLDDPFSGLDTSTAKQVIHNCFGSHSTDQRGIFPQGSTVVVVTHSIHLLPVLPIDVEVIVMENGTIAETGRFDELNADVSKSRLKSMMAVVDERAELPDDENKPFDGKEWAEDTTKEVEATDQEEDSSEKESDEEHRERGLVDFHVWKLYANSVGKILTMAILLSVTVMQVSRNGLDWWIAMYTNKHSVSPTRFVDVLLWITAVNCISVFFRSFLFAFGGLQAAKSIYSTLVSKVFGTSLSFFDSTPVGQILNRLSGDTYAVDESLPFILNLFLRDLADITGALVILFYGNKLVLLLLIPLSAIYYRLQSDYRPTSRHVRRLDAVTQSPILTMFTETLEGLPVIRAMHLQQEYVFAYGSKLNRSQRTSFLGANTGAWFGIRLDMLGVCVTSFVAIFAVVDFHLTGRVSPGILGLTLTYALPIVGKLNAILGSFVDSERQMIAVERVKEYADLPSEEQIIVRKPSRNAAFVPVNWPTHGAIEISSLSVTYSSLQGGQKVKALMGVDCRIAAGENIGVCGRTGAGKSTLLNALFRAVPWASGSICIDKVNLESVPLNAVRSRLTYIPQEVVLFSGSVRSNLDPEEKAEDHELWAALSKCGLDTAVSRLSFGLDSKVELDEATFSKGQGQLLCITRALLRQSKVLCIDEATSAIDYETEQRIHKVRLIVC